MGNEEFQKLLAEHANKTSNIRGASFTHSGVNRIPDEIVKKIGSIVSLIQAQIDKGMFATVCKKDEYLLIYNFQPLVTSPNYLCSLDMAVKPIQQINDLSNSGRKLLQLVIDGTTGDVMNNTAGMMAMGIMGNEEEEEEEEPPISHGNYHEYSNPLGNHEKLKGSKDAFDLDSSEKLKSIREAFNTEANQRNMETKGQKDIVVQTSPLLQPLPAPLTFKFFSSISGQNEPLSDMSSLLTPSGSQGLIESPNSGNVTTSLYADWSAEAMPLPVAPYCTA
jgi:hypothetical protein